MNSLENFLIDWGYIALFLFAMLESACIPIPSEITFGLGGALCSASFVTANGRHLELLPVILVGIAGSLVGSLIAYGVGRTAGRAFVDRWGKYILLSHKDLDTAEGWFKRKGSLTVLVGRVIPVMRTFISLPAGLAEMNVGLFTIFTTIGVSIWVTVLTLIGYNAADTYQSAVKGFAWVGYVVAAFFVVLLAIFYVHRFKAMKRERDHGASAG